MASTDTAAHQQPTRRDFLYIATGAVGAVGAVMTAWPLVDQMNPDAAALALAAQDVANDVADFVTQRAVPEIDDAS